LCLNGPDDGYMCVNTSGMTGREKLSTWWKHCTTGTLTTKNPVQTALDSAVRSQHLTTWAMECPQMVKILSAGYAEVRNNFQLKNQLWKILLPYFLLKSK